MSSWKDFDLDNFISEIVDKDLSSVSEDENKNENKTKGTHAIEGGISMETFATLSRTWRAMVDCTTRLKDAKGYACVLLWKIYDDPAEICFWKMRYVSWMSMALSAESFCQNSRSVLLRDIVSISKNDDGTFNRTQHKLFFKNLTKHAKNVKIAWQTF